ncbi:YncE family protein [Clostridium estertheticum]|uniref:YncE family protein n=1 Tax=Clostridium estertheticum TaxID=238834 RepID=A0A5N7IS09_9CLOT|nr:YncE family protein [Clostridium estertheticum]MBU3185416.1 YncE family protein [Clostridium estertheticum]MBU3215943.1 YncE family protein [Clostridium estertheticum]MCB2339814.1 YncE family protein [Clostridium estertheticum]MPQ33061.1 YncE family protein [Clostridium estertheticum]MPQ63719.1 YncE family protein [Clostridium estertheticum]
MRNLYVCSTSSDCISKVNLDLFIEEEKIYLDKQNLKRIGPHGIYVYENKILTANSYDNSISIVNTYNYEIESYFIGMHCNDLSVYDNKAYVICGDSDDIIVFDLEKKNIVEAIPCGNSPHSIYICKKKDLIIVANMNSDSITLIECAQNGNIKEIRVGAYPTKAVITPDGNYILVCESNIGMDNKGCINIISLKNCNVLNKIPVGNSPVDMYFNGEFCYVSNFGDGTVSILDINKYKEIKRIEVGGMPRGILEDEKYLYVGDNYNNLLFRIDKITENKKVISIGTEPTGMTLL